MDTLTWAILVTSLRVSFSQGFGNAVQDKSSDPWTVITDRLPSLDDDYTLDTRMMPSVGNGHLASQVYSDTIYINGLYTGKGSESHRARIPSVVAMRMNFTVLPTGASAKNVPRGYTMNFHTGVFEERIPDVNPLLIQRTYAHRFYTRLFVTEITLKRSPDAIGSNPVKLELLHGPESEDLNMDGRMSYRGGNWYQSGRTLVAESADVSTQDIHIYYSKIPTEIFLNPGDGKRTFYFLASIDQSQQLARETFEECSGIVRHRQEHLYNLHVDAWADMWKTGHIEMDNPGLSKITNSALYYIFSSLPSLHTAKMNGEFYGISPGGLSRGSKDEDYQGHVMWDQEVFIMPVVLMLQPIIAKHMINYRVNKMDSAYQNARTNGYLGVRFPWESAFTGMEVTPEKYKINAEQQIHVTGAVSLALRQYLAATRDYDYLSSEQVCTMIRDMAQFWVSVATWNEVTMKYDINGVMGPDELHPNVNNSMYTNAIAAISIHYSRYAACLCNRDPLLEVPNDWIMLAKSIHLEFVRIRGYHPAFEGYHNLTVSAKMVQQADTILLGYPLMWPMYTDVKRNDLDIYEKATDPEGPAMTWPMFTIGWAELRDFDRAKNAFEKSYETVQEPFKIWSEFRDGHGAVNYVTAAGGFLQTLLFGYGGLRIRVARLEFNPVLPPGVTRLHFSGIDYLGSSFNMTVSSDKVTLELTDHGAGFGLEAIVNSTGKIHPLDKRDVPVDIGKPELFTVYSKESTGCHVPEYKMGGRFAYVAEATRPSHSVSLPVLLVFVISLKQALNYYW